MKEINKDVLKQLRFKIHNVITSINREIKESQVILDNSNSYDVIIDSIRENNLIFAEEKFVESIVYLVKDLNIDDESKKKILSDIEWLHEMAIMISSSRYDKYNDEEIAIINAIINYILKIKEAEKNKIDVNTSKFNKNNAKLSNYLKLDDKLKIGEFGKEHLDSSEIGMIFEAISDTDNQFKYDVCELIRLLSIQIHNNIRDNIIDNPYVSEIDIDDETNNYAGDEELDLDTLSNLFKTNSLDFNDLSEKHQKQLAKCKFGRIKEVLEYMLANRANNRFGYLFDGNKIINELKVYQILRYSNVDILRYLVNHSEKNNVDLSKILDISGVFKKVNKKSDGETIDSPGGGDSDYVSGSFEYYKNNYKTFEQLTAEYAKQGIQIDCAREAIIHIGTVLSRPDKIVSENMQIAKNFGLKFVVYKNGRYILNSLAYLASANLKEALIAVIENGLLDYIVEFPSKLCNINMIKHLIRIKRDGELRFLPNGRIKDGAQIDGSLEIRDPRTNSIVADTYFNGLQLSDEFKANLSKYDLDIELCHTNDFIERFDSEILSDDKNVYKIRNVLISRVKVIQVSNAMQGLQEFNSLSEEDKMLFALTYYSYYTEEEFNIIKAYCYSKNKGGVVSGLSFGFRNN